MLTAEQITALRPGPDLDRAVHQWVFKRAGRPIKYSTTGSALELLDVMPLQVGRFRDSDPDMKPERPFYCRFKLGPASEPEESRVTAATAPAAMCKAALIYVMATSNNADNQG